MLFKSDRAILINELEQLLRLMIDDDADNTSEFEEIMDNFNHYMIFRMSFHSIRKSNF
jgi:hypothetical protein